MGFRSKTEGLISFLYMMKENGHQDKIEGRTKIQKIVYLTNRKHDILDFEYIGYHYGPYSKELQNTLDRMVVFNIVKEEIKRMGTNKQYIYSLTDKGINYARDSLKNLRKGESEVFSRAVTEASGYNQTPLNELLPIAYDVAGKEGLL
jgi:uncharacterized protein YwgA